MKQLIFIFLFISYFFSYSQVNKFGAPLYKNYDPLLYNASDQNWAIIQDKRGVMYFGNNDDGVLEYDGVSWQKIPITNKSSVRSLAVNSDGIVFVGAVGEFGYLNPDITGKMHYVSLSAKLDTADNQFDNVYKIYTKGESVYFCTVRQIYCYKNKKVNKLYDLPESSFMTFFLNDQFYVGNYLHGLLKTSDSDSLTLVKGGEFFARKNIISIDHFKESLLLIGTINNGIFLYDTETGYVSDTLLSEYENDFIINNWIYSTKYISKTKEYIFGSLNGGAIILNQSGKATGELTKKTGLQHDMIYYTYSSSDSVDLSPVWFAMDKGISKLYYNYPFRFFSESSGLKGGVLDVIRFNDILYVSTVYGVYYLEIENNNPQFILVEDIPNPWKFAILSPDSGEDILLVATNEGLYQIKNKNIAENIEEKTINLDPPEMRYYIYCLHASAIDRNKIFLGTNRGVISLKYYNNKWEIIDNFSNINAEIRSITEDKNGNIWAATAFEGIHRINTETKEITHFTQKDSLPSLNSNFVYNFDNDLLFATEVGIYRFNSKTSTFYPDSSFGESYTNGEKGVHFVTRDKFGNYWLSVSNNDPSIIKRWMEIVTPYENDTFIVNDVPFKPLPNLVIEVIYEDIDGYVWIGNSSGIYSYDFNFNRSYKNDFHSLIRKVSISEDSVIFNGTYYTLNKDSLCVPSFDQTPGLQPVLEYKYRNPVFSFAAPFFDEEEAIEYSYFLEGYSELWSKWTKESRAGFTNLPEGDYIFKVKAKNIYGFESQEASYSFTILPPWYRTIWAYIAYVIFGGASLVIIIKLYTRKLTRDKIRLEEIVTERTAEVVAQKEEIEEQRDKIAEINKELKDSILYAKRIQRAILPHEEFAESILTEHFILFKPKDIVSGDFYWLTKIDHFTIITAADCTGHGVPGAFMSMLGVAFLNEIVKNKSVQSTGQVLDHLREHIIKSLQQTGKSGEQKDGMDISLVAIDDRNDIMEFSGANNPLYLVRTKEKGSTLSVKVGDQINSYETSIEHEKLNLFEIKGDKMPVAIHVVMDHFTSNQIQLEKGDSIYLFSDGFADQFGGAKGKKFMYKPFKNLILTMQDKTMPEQKNILDNAIEDWKAHTNPFSGEKFEQIDDIVVVGLKI